MKDCDMIVPELVAYSHGELASEAASKVEQHLRACASCQAEAVRLRKLERLLVEHMPSTDISPTLASTFANRLAAEILAETAGSKAAGWRSWLLRPWLIPVLVTAGLVLFVLSPGLRQEPSRNLTESRETVLSAGEPRLAEKEAPQALAGLSRSGEGGAGKDRTKAVMASPPRELIARPGFFLDYPVIADLDALEASETDDSSGGAG